MELIAEITDEELGFGHSVKDVRYKVRKASRAIIMNGKGEIALLFVSKHGYHKLPGGGVEKGEDHTEALLREAIEEVGVEIELGAEVGAVIEYRDKFEMVQVSYCYFAKVVKELAGPSFTAEEQEGGFMVKWVKLKEAIELVENDRTEDYMGLFISARDLRFLLRAEKLQGRI